MTQRIELTDGSRGYERVLDGVGAIASGAAAGVYIGIAVAAAASEQIFDPLDVSQATRYIMAALVAAIAAALLVRGRTAGWPVAAIGAGAGWLGLLPDQVSSLTAQLFLISVGGGLLVGGAMSAIGRQSTTSRWRGLYGAAFAGALLAEVGLLKSVHADINQADQAAVFTIALAVAAAGTFRSRLGDGQSPASHRPAAVILAASVAIAVAAELAYQIADRMNPNGNVLLALHSLHGCAVIVFGALLIWYAAHTGGVPAAVWVVTGLGVGALLYLGASVPPLTMTVVWLVAAAAIVGAALAFALPKVPWEPIALLAGGVVANMAAAQTPDIGSLFSLSQPVDWKHNFVLIAAAVAAGSGLTRAAAEPTDRVGVAGLALGFVALALAAAEFGADSGLTLSTGGSWAPVIVILIGLGGLVPAGVSLFQRYEATLR